ncbi:DUF6932 family protein [Clostridium thermopalmarium]|uniref:Polymerase nucleotidyl transferase domain-containing protein n=1 Tax=Clostridium thermopalmarium DSM 5974 TaxID=1121340 RepID=A0A2T0APJ1_9CLOT|nr:hypothetical protein [Clostridium thermopalmarium]PRR70937.1 hypothetical protein CPAL_20270 [Clostridium thermopalmarium DSM 5974]PVZ28861.1 hypothetical protein LX19_00165 [Clostridium thermopalmarium DSM 5974]
MAIPSLNGHGILPEGIYECTMEDIKEKFCSIENKEHRCKLFKKLEQYLKDLKKFNTKYELIIDGSFITDKKFPSDIDFILAYDFEYSPKTNFDDWLMLLNGDCVKQKYGLQVFPTFLDSDLYDETIEFCKQVKEKPGIIKGLLRVRI